MSASGEDEITELVLPDNSRWFFCTSSIHVFTDYLYKDV